MSNDEKPLSVSEILAHNLENSVSGKEKQILRFWKENKIFEKSLEKPVRPSGGKESNFTFYDGPPFATGLPHYGHILASIIKDAVPRYQAMHGKRIPRKWGWDCHGLPIENLIEQELGLKTKQDIEKIGIEKFNESAHASVLRYAKDWKEIIPRIGRWVDMDNDYRTMDWKYTESIWWVFKTLYDKGLIYEGNKPMHICPRCETTLANFEVNQGYKDIKDITVTVKLELEDEPGTFLLAWTTTPWTLPGNVALAVNSDIEYVKVSNGKESYILAKKIFEKWKEKTKGSWVIWNNEGEEIADKVEFDLMMFCHSPESVETFNGSKLIGKKYKPLFPCTEKYVQDTEADLLQNAFKVYSGDFVTTEEGVGIVHIAPAFGEDDMNLGKENNLPFVQHVGMDGKIKSWVSCLKEGMSVKPKDTKEDPSAHLRTDIEIIKWLQENGKFFSKQNITHSYPHCWRCDTPLLNYSASSWFVKVTTIKNKLIKNNKKINWVPSHLKEGRFGKWLEGARDWAISRSRYWGAPLPVWKCEKCNEVKAIGSIEDIEKNSKKSGNKYFAMRHGESESNVLDTINSDINNNNIHLTAKGIDQIKDAGKNLKKKKIDLIFSSDFTRTKETAEITAEVLGIDKNKIIFDEHLREINTGIFDGKNQKEYHSYFSSFEEKFTKVPSEGENLTQLKTRVSEFLYDIENKYQNKNILIVSHEYTIWCLFAGAIGADSRGAAEIKEKVSGDFVKNGEIKELEFTLIPHNKKYEIDMHRPYIDDIELDCKCGKTMRRIQDVFDCWFESGSMPYGQSHYPFENKKEFEKNFPAEFIAEGLDQTRGWFYTLLVLSTALFNDPAYKNVIVNGIILAEDGQKMSKRLKNYPDPMEIVDKYGADALRYYFLSSPVVRAESLNFSEKGVDEVYKKVILRLRNVVSFYEMYAGSGCPALENQCPSSSSVLDKWMIVRLNELSEHIASAMDNYELDKAVRPIGDFIDDFSTWYVRRSRDRFKDDSEDKKQVIAITRFILIGLAKLIAPFMPFIADDVYKRIGGEKESVHLENWAESKNLSKEDQQALEDMKEVRKIVSLGLEERAKAKIKVRQPLASLRSKNKGERIQDSEELLQLIKDEVNVKEVVLGEKIENEVEIDINLTPELIQEGAERELTRVIQGLRKKAGLTPNDKIKLRVETSDEGQKLFTAEVKKTTNVSVVGFFEVVNGEEIEIGELKFKLLIN